ncbi:hypothetical protein D3C76_1152490 [compost metagenome]
MSFYFLVHSPLKPVHDFLQFFLQGVKQPQILINGNLQVFLGHLSGGVEEDGVVASYLVQIPPQCVKHKKSVGNQQDNAKKPGEADHGDNCEMNRQDLGNLLGVGIRQVQLLDRKNIAFYHMPDPPGPFPQHHKLPEIALHPYIGYLQQG